MVSTDTYYLDIRKKDNVKVLKMLKKIPSSHFAIIDKKQSSSTVRYKIAISQEALSKLDDKLKKSNIERKFTLL